MRQAGRYLPEYRALKEKHTLDEMFTTPELAATITSMPIASLGVDAAILFADILTLPSAMGFKIRFDTHHGPVIENPISKNFTEKDVYDFDNLSFLEAAIRLSKQKLPRDIPLLGFAGGPFTVLTYLLEGKISLQFPQIIKFIIEHNEEYHALMAKITKNTIRYLQLQKKAGIDAFQLFDTWAGVLRPSDYAQWVLPYVQEIFAVVDLPSIYYVKNCAHLLALMNKSKAEFLSVDHTVILGHNNVIAVTKKGIQGNLFNGLLYADKKVLREEVNDTLVGAKKHKRFIFNLSHGVLPDTDVEKLKYVVELVHKFPWKKQ